MYSRRFSVPTRRPGRGGGGGSGSFTPPPSGALVGSLNTISDGVGTLTRAELNQLAGTASTITDGAGALSSLYQLAGIANTLTDGTAAIGSFPALAGLANTISDSTGALTRAELKLLAGNGITVSDGAITVLVAKDLLAQGNTVSDGTAQLDTSGGTTVNIGGSANTVTDGTATLAKLAALAATAATVSDGAATFSKLDDITGTAATVSNGTGSFGVSQLPPTDPLMSLLWHSELGIGLVSSEVDTWTDQIQSVVVTAPSSTNRPAYAADGANFLSRSVVQCAITGSKSLASASLTAGVLPAISTRPYWVGVVRMRSGGSARTLFSCVNSGNTTRVWAVNGNSSFLVQNPSSATSVSPGVLGTTVHFVEIWLDGTNANVRVDGTLTSVAFTGSMLDNMIKIFVGSLTGNTSVGDASWAALMCFTALPTSGYIASLRSWANGYFGSPP